MWYCTIRDRYRKRERGSRVDWDKEPAKIDWNRRVVANIYVRDWARCRIELTNSDVVLINSSLPNILISTQSNHPHKLVNLIEHCSLRDRDINLIMMKVFHQYSTNGDR